MTRVEVTLYVGVFFGYTVVFVVRLGRTWEVPIEFMEAGVLYFSPA